MQMIETSIMIQAPIERVWTILTEIDNYRNWNPFMIDVSGQLVAGQKIRFHKAMRINSILPHSLIIVLDAESYKLCWTTTWLHPLLFKTMNSFTLEAATDGKSTHVIQFESQHGAVSILSMPSMLDSLRSRMVSMNKALKQQAEDKKHRLPHSLTSGA